jgi:thiamine biosynthesis lipoprotein ApbE
VASAVLDLGGQVAVWRAPGASSAEPLTIGLADPVARERQLLTIDIDHGSLSTAGDSERGIVVDGRRYSHHLDPRTGRPAATLGSVTVWAPTALQADCLSTGLFVLGIDAIGDFALRHPELGIVVIRADREDGRRVAWASRALEPHLAMLAGDLDLRFWGAPAASSDADRRRASGAIDQWLEPSRSNAGAHQP